MNEAISPETVLIPPGANLSEAARQRLREAATKPCGTCAAHLWRLTKRLTGRDWQIWLQCDKCGSATGQAFARKEHLHWQDYPEFDARKHEQWYEDKLDFEYAQRLERQEAQRAEYADWLAVSPEWAKMRGRVLARAKNLCEACLEQGALNVHHLTYELGKLPPAYYLVALCRACHNRMHTPGDEWGMPIPPKPATQDADIGEEEIDGEIPY